MGSVGSIDDFHHHFLDRTATRSANSWRWSNWASWPLKTRASESGLVGFKVQRDELAVEMAELQKRISNGEATITPKKIAQLAVLLRDKLQNGPPEL